VLPVLALWFARKLKHAGNFSANKS
jgi:hypothetical protein